MAEPNEQSLAGKVKPNVVVRTLPDGSTYPRWAEGLMEYVRQRAREGGVQLVLPCLVEEVRQ